MPRSPVVSGEQLIKFLTDLGYEVVRQRGSHVRLKNLTERNNEYQFSEHRTSYLGITLKKAKKLL